jgi:hypothetical protein
MLNYLEERGTHITNADFEKAEKAEGKIAKLCKDDYEKLVTPKTAFVLFKTSEAR